MVSFLHLQMGAMPNNPNLQLETYLWGRIARFVNSHLDRVESGDAIDVTNVEYARAFKVVRTFTLRHHERALPRISEVATRWLTLSIKRCVAIRALREGQARLTTLSPIDHLEEEDFTQLRIFEEGVFGEDSGEPRENEPGEGEGDEGEPGENEDGEGEGEEGGGNGEEEDQSGPTWNSEDKDVIALHQGLTICTCPKGGNPGERSEEDGVASSSNRLTACNRFRLEKSKTVSDLVEWTERVSAVPDEELVVDSNSSDGTSSDHRTFSRTNILAAIIRLSS
ncbi:hypothetical protein M231_02552 [Tremella mesenterica]|uniref:Uncharacterized protein n=1 Tax=Tremella mesenterica TaxID=5217 RepID=A0A4Q1BQ89_TREME|nr:hypothetical protein M231_02552 [Tremella mesenterica]